MAEQQKPEPDSVLTDKDKFKEKPEQQKVAHMGDKPGSALEQKPPDKPTE